MSTTATDPRIDRLYQLLPAIHRMRDAEQDRVLQALLRVIAEQVNAVEDGIAQQYENWFIETAAAGNANRLLESEMPVADRTSLAYRLVLGRDPSSEEIDEAEDLVSSIDTSSDSTTNGSPTAMRAATSASPM